MPVSSATVSSVRTEVVPTAIILPLSSAASLKKYFRKMLLNTLYHIMIIISRRHIYRGSRHTHGKKADGVKT